MIEVDGGPEKKVFEPVVPELTVVRKPAPPTHSRLNIYERLHATMQEVSYIQKEQRSGMRYTVVLHDAVTKAVRPALIKNGIVYFPYRMEVVQDGDRTEVKMDVRFQAIDDPNDYFLVPTFGYGIDSGDKGPGKAMSYAVKYALLKALGLETGDDPDQDQDVAKGDTKPGAKELSQDEWVEFDKGIRSKAADCQSIEELNALWAENEAQLNVMKTRYSATYKGIVKAFSNIKKGFAEND